MQEPQEKYPAFTLVYLMITAFVSGAMVMVVEILGSRVIGPFFGVSLFVWTSLITVTLVALAAGYAAGGVMADRRRHPDNLYFCILLAGVLALIIPPLKGPVIRIFLPMGVRGGALLSSAVLFGPVLLLLGFVSPYLVRLAARELENIGRTVGILYSISTVGSVVGTILTGFVLITHFGVNRIFTVVGGMLVLLAVIYFVALRRKWPYLLALALPLLPLQPEPVRHFVKPSGTRVSVLHDSDSYYGNLKVVDYDYGRFKTRELAIDGLVQGGIDLATGQSIYDYPYYLQFLPPALRPEGTSCLVIGLGAGIVPRWYESLGVRTDVVDIDPEVVRLAREHFGLRVSGETTVADARHFLLSAKKRYDYVILDVFSGDTTPGHILSVEALRLVRNRLAPGGIFAANLIGNLGEHGYMTASLMRTLGEVFDTVVCYPTFAPSTKSGYGNLIMVAYDGPRKTLDRRSIRASNIHPLARKRVMEVIGSTASFPAETESILLTDDYNPIEFYDIWVKERLRGDILKGTDFDVLL